MWYDTEEYSKTKRFARILNATLIASIPLLWTIVLIRICMDFELLPASRISESICKVFGGSVAFFGYSYMSINRNQLTEIIKEVDEKFFAFRKETSRNREWWVDTRKMYIFEGNLFFLGMAMGFFVGFSQIIFMCLTGSLFYNTIWITNESYSFLWWMQASFQGLVVTYSGVFFSAKNCILADLVYTITRLIRFQAAKIMVLNEEERNEVDYQKLSTCLKETIELYR